MTTVDEKRPRVDAAQARQVAEEARETRWDRPSFGRELFLGRLRLDLVDPMPESPTSAAGEAFLRRLREFCENEVDGRRIEREDRVPDEVIDGLRDLGALAIKIPEEYGGLGLPSVYYHRALMLVATTSPAIGALLSAHQSIGVPRPVELFGTEAQKREFLPRCTREISAFLLTEPDVGSDPARLATIAEPSADGRTYRLNGVKLWTTNGVLADLLVVMARVPRSDGHRGGVTAFVVEADAPGVTVEHRNSFMGLRGIENGVTRLHDVVVPAANRIGREGDGLRIALTTLNTGRLALPAMCAGAAKWCLRIAREWSAQRVQWGRPIGAHEAIAGKVSFIAASAFALDAVLELSGRLADADRHDIRIEAALAKLHSSELAWQVADELVQIRGGRGYETAESLAARGERGVPVEQLLRDLRINRIFEGSSEIMRLLIAREAVDAHLSVAGDIIDPEADLSRKARAAARAGGFYARWLPTLAVGRGQLPGAYGEYGRLAEHLRFVERASRRIARQTFLAMARWQGALEHRQLFLGRIVDIGAELYAMSACCVHARSSDSTAVELADAYCRQARLRVEELFRRLWDNTDAADRMLARRVLDGRYAWLEDGVLDPSTDGPWIADTMPGPSRCENVRRVLRRSSVDQPAPHY
ncbi:acyl-CoA dehydrogenase [Saccharopolyspora subtropica]|uniref:Acyl-CoA dehydrogenase n=1 Tax=Saccharopolyspora thermophila TaxID=89367 RepID=A0A917K352_9PSEU|nr:acyl-CoA dehydrogenase family protein [Saccharopolyspora subtropica]GGI99249.1 acyl-CoA dehydrogenase [Saccharopolyspora subtropica]